MKVELMVDSEPSSRNRNELVEKLWDLLGGRGVPAPLDSEEERIPTPESSAWNQRRILYTSEPGVRVPGFLFTPGFSASAPTPDQRRPTILYLHSHSSDWATGKEEVVTGKGRVPPGLVDRFIEYGFNVFAADFRCFSERSTEDEGESARGHLLHGGTLWGRMLWDQIRALDLLSTHPLVDPHRIGCFGFSMGSTAGWWLAALDERITAGVGACCLSSYDTMEEDGVLHRHGWYYFVPGVAPSFGVHGILALIAPRPFLFLNGDSDQASPIRGAEKSVKTASRMYRNLGTEERLRLRVFRETGHILTPEMVDESIDWLVRWLKPDGVS